VREKEMVREYFFYTNLDLYLRKDLEHYVTSSLPNLLFQKVKDGRMVATAIPRHFAVKVFKNGVYHARE